MMEQLSLWGVESKSVPIPAQHVEALPLPAQPAQVIATEPEPTQPEPTRARARKVKQEIEGDEESGGSLSDWKQPTRTRYEEAGEEERAIRDRLFAWGQQHGFPTVRFKHLGNGVPRMHYYPYIGGNENCWRMFRDHHKDDEIVAAIAFFTDCDRGEATIDQYFAGW